MRLWWRFRKLRKQLHGDDGYELVWLSPYEQGIIAAHRQMSESEESS